MNKNEILELLHNAIREIESDLQKEKSKMQKLYMVIQDDCWEGKSKIDTWLFSTYKLAKSFFEDLKEHIKSETETEYNITEDEEKHFAFYDEGNYNNDHFCLDILEKEIDNEK